MTNTKIFTVRGVPTVALRMIDESAKLAGRTRNQQIVKLFEWYSRNSQAVKL